MAGKPERMHCQIVRLPDELDALVEEHRQYLLQAQRYSTRRQRAIPTAEAVRDLVRRGLRARRGARASNAPAQLRLFGG